MICETCHGSGRVLRCNPWGARAFFNGPWELCPACGGCGEQHCCEGEQWSDREREIEQVKK